ncbi:uncharacterized protein LOC141627886 [Silene latifolia]|uniref:uncharacterized protein LOC141627886 n=1 Tax=Silene latifolia TaxID=37657 RepID=UPI003D770576
MGPDESLKSMSSRFSSIINELANLGRTYESEDIVRKVLRSLTIRWRQKVTAIEEGRDLTLLKYESLMGILMAHELVLDEDAKEIPKAKGLALNAFSSDNESDVEEEVALLSKRIAIIIRKQNQGKFDNFKSKKSTPSFSSSSSSSSSRFMSRMRCFKCGDRDHQIRNCPNGKKKSLEINFGGESDSEDDESPKEKKEEKLCLTTTYKPRSQRKTCNDSLRCLMANSEASDSDSDDEVSLFNLKVQIRTLSRNQIINLLDETLDTSYEQNKRLDAMQIEIESIAKENIDLNLNADYDALLIKNKDLLIRNDSCTASINKRESYERDFHKRKYVGLPEYILCKFCGKTGHGPKRGSSRWYLDSGCSRHMTGNRNHFLSLSAYNGGNVTFGDNMKGEVIGIGKIGKSLSHSNDDVLLVHGLRHNLISIYQLCDKGNMALNTPTPQEERLNKTE